MPFAGSFRAMMDLPFAGDTVGGFAVESVDVRDEAGGPGGLHAYSVNITLRGPGGKQGVKQALRALLSTHPTTFSAYGTPYHLWFGKPEIESHGNKRYAVKIKGAGARANLEDELHRFLNYLSEENQLAAQPGHAIGDELVEDFLEQYQVEIRRKVQRYKRKLRKSNAGA